ncbi:hypothetical protein K492DRAFT_154627 [Lichtheimia hyalospora FSU 10163]|nr:hypothetical protein K492DRAFT_154627 [Lichtheimia hyalospora FSU 10163]
MQDIHFTPYTNFESFEEKRRKTARACLHCQKAHLTCDDGRPCQRCIKRGLTATCMDAPRRQQQQQQQQQQTKQMYASNDAVSSNVHTSNQGILDHSQPPTDESHMVDPTSSNAVLANLGAGLGFGSETAGLEYGFIGNMLGVGDWATATPASLLATTTDTTATTNNNNNNTLSHNTINNATPAMHLASSNNTMPTPMSSQQQQQAFSTSTTAQHQYLPSVFPMSATVAIAPGANPLANEESNTSSFNNRPTTTSSPSTSSSPTIERRPTQKHYPERKVCRPFNYAEGFHYLIEYVKEKMNREDLMRISRSLALFRPSFLALIMNLTEDDLVFMEQCIQRTLLEYEKLISFSGTPTVVWRRTGEVCLVSKEFLLLTQWPRHVLLDKKTYIYELMDNRSAVDYWERFSLHAFDNTDESCMSSCILKTPTQKPVPCAFCFTIKRDIFDLPSVIIGNFLPILG